MKRLLLFLMVVFLILSPLLACAPQHEDVEYVDPSLIPTPGEDTAADADEEPQNQPVKLSAKRVFLVGDSTLCIYYRTDNAVQRASDGKDIMGWGFYIPDFFQPSITFVNYAAQGRTTRNYTTSTVFYDRLLAEMNKGDYLFIQLARNDANKEEGTVPDLPLERVDSSYKDENGNYSYQACLYYYYILPALERGAIPVLLSPLSPRDPDTGRADTEQMDKYTEAMRDLAEKKDLLFVDFSDEVAQFYDALVDLKGPEGTKPIHAFLTEERTSPDDAHLSHYGAYKIAEIIAGNLGEQIPEFAPYLLDTPKEYVAE